MTKAQARSSPDFKMTYSRFKELSDEAKKHYKNDTKEQWNQFAKEYREIQEELDIDERPDIDWGS